MSTSGTPLPFSPLSSSLLGRKNKFVMQIYSYKNKGIDFVEFGKEIK